MQPLEDMNFKREYCYLTAALIWGVPGIIVAARGFVAYGLISETQLWWIGLITLFVLVSFFYMFRGIVRKYIGHIASLPERTTVWQTFPLRGWILVVCMSSLGVVLRVTGITPTEFTASFYSGLGPMLVWSAICFGREMFKRSKIR